MSLWKYCYPLIVFVLLGASYANAQDNVTCSANQYCIDAERWDLAVSVGYGERTNPLKDADDIPLYIIPSIAYYGDSFFFDNGNFGFNLIEAERFSINLATTYTDDSGYFNRWDLSNIFSLNAYSDRNVPIISPFIPEGEAPELDMNTLESRRFTALAGVEAFYYSQIGSFKAGLYHDVLNIHNGLYFDTKWNYAFAHKQWVFDAALVANWKSADLIRYYYGVRENESLYWHQYYKPSSGWNYGAELTTRYVIAPHWDIIMAARYTQLASAIKNSPMLTKGYSTTYFVGVAYSF